MGAEDPEVTQTAEEQEELEQIAEQNGASPSLMDELRAKRRALSSERRVELDVPGYGGQLVARYAPLEFEPIKKAAQKQRRRRRAGGTSEPAIAADSLIRACKEILVRDDDDELVPMAVAVNQFEDEEPVRYDERLAQVLDIEAPHARGVVFAVFGNDIALLDHYQELYEWSADASEDVDDDF